MWVLSISTFHSVVHCSVDKWQHYLIEGRVYDSIYLDIPLLDNRSSERLNFTVSPVHCVLIRGYMVAGHDKGILYIQTSLYFHCNVHGQKKGNIFIIWKVILTVLIIIFTVSVFSLTEPGQSAGVRWQIHRAELRPLWLYRRDPARLRHHFPDPEELQIQTKTGSALVRTNRRRKWTISGLSGKQKHYPPHNPSTPTLPPSPTPLKK